MFSGRFPETVYIEGCVQFTQLQDDGPPGPQNTGGEQKNATVVLLLVHPQLSSGDLGAPLGFVVNDLPCFLFLEVWTFIVAVIKAFLVLCA